MPVSTKELLDLLEGLKQRIAFADMDDFYYFSRACMVKDEKYFDRFDRAFGCISRSWKRWMILSRP